jgi:hypothetical protein
VLGAGTADPNGAVFPAVGYGLAGPLARARRRPRIATTTTTSSSTSTASQGIGKRVRIFLDLLNLTNEPLRYYRGVPDRPDQEEYYRWCAMFGVKLDL